MKALSTTPRLPSGLARQWRTVKLKQEHHWPDSEQCSALSTALACIDQWRHITDSNEPNFVNTSLAKVSNFKVFNVNNVDIFYGMVSTCMFFLLMYSFHYIDNAFMCTA